MVIGLKRGFVELADHDPEWEILAADTIQRLWRVFGSTAKDIQHVGSTSIRHIKAKPIIDIAVAVDDFSEVEALTPALEAEGFMRRDWFPNENEQMLYAVGYDVEQDDRVTTHYIHIVKNGSTECHDYINFRDYLNANSSIAKEYETLKIRLAAENPYDKGREKYLAGKHDFIVDTQQAARIWTDFGKVFTQITPITKGWSEDKKYCVTKVDGTKYLLRITPIERYEVRKSLFEILKQVDALGIPMCRPVEFGIYTDGVYSLQSWIDGEDLDTALPLLSETEQYVLGLKSGEIVREMHTIPAPETQEEWESRFNRKTDMKIQKYNECGLRFDGDEHILAYIEQNRHLLKNRPQCFQHGDYHIGNMMLENGELKIIDFDRYDFGDPWEEFNRIVWSAAASPYFTTGQLRGYFGGEPPLEFFKLLAFYIASNTLSSIYWAVQFGQSDLDTMMKQAQDVLDWFDNMQNPVPTWYLKDFYIQWIDGVPFQLKKTFDLDFIHRYGTVFKVFDEQGSGNLCFGVRDGDKRYFVKFAGAPSAKYDVNTIENAIERLKFAVQTYQDLAHPNLIKFIKVEEIGGGLAAIFEWTDALCMNHTLKDHRIFMCLPSETRIQIFEEILEFHAHATEKGYNAFDFYDCSIMWDSDNHKTVICDIDFYSKSWYEGIAGFWDDSLFASPEERTSGAKVDEISTVYNMGATAFALLSNYDRSPEAWSLSKDQYAIVKKAISDERDNRQQSIQQLMEEWRAAK